MVDRHLIDVHILLIRDDHLLLSRRRDVDPRFDGLWHLPSGKLDAGESVLAAAAREAQEEIGVRIAPGDLRHAHTLHANGSGVEPRLGVFFEVLRWVGHPANREPGKCSGLDWFPLDAMPGGLVAYSAAGIAGYRAGEAFGTLGW